MEKTFTTVELPEDKKANNGTFCLTEELDFWWKTVKGRPLGHNFTWSRFLEELKMRSSMTVIQYTSKFTELSRFVPKFVSHKRLKIRRFQVGLAFYIRKQLAGQLILTYQELYQ